MNAVCALSLTTRDRASSDEIGRETHGGVLGTPRSYANVAVGEKQVVRVLAALDADDDLLQDHGLGGAVGSRQRDPRSRFVEGRHPLARQEIEHVSSLRGARTPAPPGCEWTESYVSATGPTTARHRREEVSRLTHTRNAPTLGRIVTRLRVPSLPPGRNACCLCRMAAATRKNTKAEINTALVRAARAHRVAAAELLGEVGLHPGQEALLMELWQGDGQTQAELAESLAVEPPTITKMLQRMEAAGLVQRKPHPDDRRAQRVFLTARGKRLQQKVDRLWNQLATRAVSGLSDRQQATLRSMLHTVTENLSG